MALEGKVELRDINLKQFRELVTALKDPNCAITELDISLLTLNGKALNAEQAIEIGQALLKNTSVPAPNIGFLLDSMIERPPVPLSFEEALKGILDQKEMKEVDEPLDEPLKDPRIRANLIEQFKAVTTVDELESREMELKEFPKVNEARLNGELSGISGMIEIENEKAAITKQLEFLQQKKDGGTIKGKLFNKYGGAEGAIDALKNCFKKIDDNFDHLNEAGVQDEIEKMVNDVSLSILMRHPEHFAQEQIKKDIRDALNDYIAFKHIASIGPDYAKKLNDRLIVVDELLSKNKPLNIQGKYLEKYKIFGVTFDPNEGYQKMFDKLQENRNRILGKSNQTSMALQSVAPIKEAIKTAMSKHQEAAVTRLKEVQGAYRKLHSAQSLHSAQPTAEPSALPIVLRSGWKDNFSEWKGELETFLTPSSPSKSSSLSPKSAADSPKSAADSPKRSEENSFLSFGMMRSGSKSAIQDTQNALSNIIGVLGAEEKAIKALILVEEAIHEGWGVNEERVPVKNLDALMQSYQKVVKAFEENEPKIKNPILKIQVSNAKAAFVEELGWVKETMEKKAKPERPQKT